MKSLKTGSQNSGYNWIDRREPIYIGASLAGDVLLLILGVLVL